MKEGGAPGYRGAAFAMGPRIAGCLCSVKGGAAEMKIRTGPLSQRPVSEPEVTMVSA